MSKQPQPHAGASDSPDDLLTACEAADLLRSSAWTLRGWRQCCIGPPFIQYRPHGAVFYRRSDLERWLASRRTTPSPHV